MKISGPTIEEVSLVLQKRLGFLVDEFNYEGPVIRTWSNRELHMNYRHNKESIDIQYEVGGGLWGQALSVTPGPHIGHISFRDMVKPSRKPGASMVERDASNWEEFVDNLVVALRDWVSLFK